MEEKKDTFKECCFFVKTNTEKLDQGTLLKLYSYYKQTTKGDATGASPGILSMKARAKYDAWAELKGKSTEDAMQEYVDLINSLKG